MPKNIVLKKNNQFDLQINSLQEAWQFAEIVSQSNFVPKDFQGKPGNCLLAMQFGAELGLAPMQALQNVAVINGRPSIWGDAALALVEASPECEDFQEYFDMEPENLSLNLAEWPDSLAAVCIVKRKGREQKQVRFSIADAKRAGLWNKPNKFGQSVWQKYPKRMLQMRARSFALRDSFPHVLKGLILGEEAMDYKQEAIDVNNYANKLSVPEQHPVNPPIQQEPKTVMITKDQHNVLEQAIVNIAKANTIDIKYFRNRVKDYCLKKWNIKHWWKENLPGMTQADYTSLMLKLPGFADQVKTPLSSSGVACFGCHVVKPLEPCMVNGVKKKMCRDCADKIQQNVRDSHAEPENVCENCGKHAAELQPCYINDETRQICMDCFNNSE